LVHAHCHDYLTTKRMGQTFPPMDWWAKILTWNCAWKRQVPVSLPKTQHPIK
jgi:hypothetical protein